MARYRKIDTRVWGDAKFKRLTPIAPSGQALWFYLLTNKRTTNIPGLFEAGEVEMSHRLGWPLDDFRSAFRELEREGMAKADWSAPLVYIPNAVKYDPPANPNVVRGWRVVWDELPECGLKTEAWHGLRLFVEGFGKGFGKGFREALPEPFREPFREPFGEPSRKGMANPEPEPEPEPEPDTTPPTEKRVASVSLSADPKPDPWKRGDPITHPSQLETVLGEFGIAIQVAPTDRAKGSSLIRAGPISPDEYEHAQSKMKKGKGAAYWLGIIARTREEAEQIANGQSAGPRKPEPSRYHELTSEDS